MILPKHTILLVVVLAVLIWSGINPYDYPTWALEVAPVLITLPLLAFTYNRFRLTDILYVLIAIHAVVLMVGGHYTYARVPLFDVIAEWMDASRNGYDGVGHFAQGFIPAIAIRELLLRLSGIRSRGWMNAAIVFSSLGIAALYEVAEWLVAVAIGQGANEFLGTQGDVWDTQKDMALCVVGAIAGIVTLSRWHDRQLQKVS